MESNYLWNILKFIIFFSQENTISVREQYLHSRRFLKEGQRQKNRAKKIYEADQKEEPWPEDVTPL